MSATIETSQRFWNEKAKENPYWYVSSYGPYDGRNLDDFWKSGLTIWDSLKGVTGYFPHGTVVEIGCGVGRITRAIAKEVGHVIAFDLSREMIEIAKQQSLENVEFRLANECRLGGLPDKSADLVLAYCVFQHLPSIGHLRSYLREMVRVAKPGAVISFTVCPGDWRWKLLPLMRLKGFIKSKLRLQPPDLYRMEWLGIRPSAKEIQSACPVTLKSKALDPERILYWGIA